MMSFNSCSRLVVTLMVTVYMLKAHLFMDFNPSMFCPFRVDMTKNKKRPLNLNNSNLKTLK